MALTHLEAAVVAAVRSMTDEEILGLLISALSAQAQAKGSGPGGKEGSPRRGSSSGAISLEDEVVAALSQHSHGEGASMGQLVKDTSGTDNQVRTAVRKLEARGVVTRSGERRFTRYRLGKAAQTEAGPNPVKRARGSKKKRTGGGAPPGAAANTSAAARKKGAAGLTKTVEKLIRASDGLAMGEIVNAVNATRNEVRTVVLALKSAGKIHQAGERRFTRYAATAKAAERASLKARGKS